MGNGTKAEKKAARWRQMIASAGKSVLHPSVMVAQTLKGKGLISQQVVEMVKRNWGYQNQLKEAEEAAKHWRDLPIFHVATEAYILNMHEKWLTERRAADMTKGDNIDLRDFYDIFGPIPDDEADSQISPHNSKLNTHEVISGYGPFDFELPPVTTNPVDKQEFFSQLAYRPKPQAEQGGKTAAEDRWGNDGRRGRRGGR